MSNPAKMSRLEKDRAPERYCTDKRCLWNVARSGACPKHMKGAGMVAVSGNDTARPSFSASDHLTPQAPVTEKCSYCEAPLSGRVKYRWDDRESCLKCFEDRVEEVMDKMYQKSHPIPNQWGGKL